MKFGVREICNVTFKAAAENQRVGTEVFKKYQPVFSIDTAQTSEMSQESTTVYAQGGRGYNRLIAWEGEKTMTFTVTDALISPMGLAVLSGAGLFNASEGADGTKVHVHISLNEVSENGTTVDISYDKLAREIGLNGGEDINVCTDVDIFAAVVDGDGSMKAWLKKPLTVSAPTATAGKVAVVKKGQKVTFAIDTADKTVATNKTLKIDFYVVLAGGAQEIVIEPGSFGGYFYVEADTLFRRQEDGQDMAATLTFPRVKIQSAFTFSMAASGDPSTFDFTMDAFPGYTRFDSTKEVCVVMDVVTGETATAAAASAHDSHADASTSKTTA